MDPEITNRYGNASFMDSHESVTTEREIELEDFLANAYSVVELQELCFDLGIDLQYLPGTKSKLISYMVENARDGGFFQNLIDAAVFYRKSRSDEFKINTPSGDEHFRIDPLLVDLRLTLKTLPLENIKKLARRNFVKLESGGGKTQQILELIQLFYKSGKIIDLLRYILEKERVVARDRENILLSEKYIELLSQHEEINVQPVITHDRTPSSISEAEDHLLLSDLLESFFRSDDFEVLCFMLGVEADNFSGSLSSKLFSLIRELNLSKSIPSLLNTVKFLKPDIDLSHFAVTKKVGMSELRLGRLQRLYVNTEHHLQKSDLFLLSTMYGIDPENLKRSTKQIMFISLLTAHDFNFNKFGRYLNLVNYVQQFDGTQAALRRLSKNQMPEVENELESTINLIEILLNIDEDLLRSIMTILNISLSGDTYSVMICKAVDDMKRRGIFGDFVKIAIFFNHDLATRGTRTFGSNVPNANELQKYEHIAVFLQTISGLDSSKISKLLRKHSDIIEENKWSEQRNLVEIIDHYVKRNTVSELINTVASL